MATETKITKDKGVGDEIEAACEKCGDGTTHVIRAAIQEYNCDQPHPDFSFEWINR